MLSYLKNYMRSTPGTTMNFCGDKVYRLVAVVLFAGCLFCLPVQAENFEPEQLTLSASDLRGAKPLRGEHYRINDRVTNAGFLNHYTVTSDFGEFKADSNYQLDILIREIAAIAELKTVQKSEVFTTAVVNTAKKPIETIQKIADEPVETLKGVPQGVGRLFKRTVRQVSDAAKDVKEYSDERKQKKAEAAADPSSKDSSVSTEEVVEKSTEVGKKLGKNYLGQDKSIRLLAKQLKVDPYTANKVLVKEMEDVAWAMTAGSFGVGTVVPGLPGGIGTLSDINDLVWDTNPIDLQLRNEKSLRNMGMPDLLIVDFFENKNFTPSMRTIIVASLENLENTIGKQLLIEAAAAAENKVEARSYVHISAKFAEYHLTDTKIASIVKGSAWPLAQTGKGSFVFFIPVDYLSWTANVGASAQALMSHLRSKSSDSEIELRVQGKVSKLARSKLESLGYVVSLQDAA